MHYEFFNSVRHQFRNHENRFFHHSFPIAKIDRLLFLNSNGIKFSESCNASENYVQLRKWFHILVMWLDTSEIRFHFMIYFWQPTVLSTRAKMRQNSAFCFSLCFVRSEDSMWIEFITNAAYMHECDRCIHYRKLIIFCCGKSTMGLSLNLLQRWILDYCRCSDQLLTNKSLRME